MKNKMTYIKKKIINWILDKLEGKRTIWLQKNPVLDWTLHRVDGITENIGESVSGRIRIYDVKSNTGNLIDRIVIKDSVTNPREVDKRNDYALTVSANGQASLSAINFNHGEDSLENV